MIGDRAIWMIGDRTILAINLVDRTSTSPTGLNLMSIPLIGQNKLRNLPQIIIRSSMQTPADSIL